MGDDVHKQGACIVTLVKLLNMATFFCNQSALIAVQIKQCANYGISHFACLHPFITKVLRWFCEPYNKVNTQMSFHKSHYLRKVSKLGECTYSPML